ncbi:MAG TPA: nuclear transport factor 2 family protein [Ktedonobacteraceae bacterium]|jgi:ketosteroid isomerase-like protein
MAEAHKKNAEAAIQGLLDAYVKSLHDKNIEGIMALYAQDVVPFDIVPPLRYRGAEAFRNVWAETFSSLQSPIGYEIHDLSITVGDAVAFTRSFNRISGNAAHRAEDRSLAALDRLLP